MEWDAVWTLMPLGNPGADYANTRHNMGRLMLQRWMGERNLNPPVKKKFTNGTLYALSDHLQALVPSTFMNLSGQVCAEADAVGIYARKLVLLHDDKDLPLGYGRFRLEGSDGGHNGLKSIFHHAETQAIARLRLGIGPFERPLHEYVLGEWTEPEWALIDEMDAPFARFLELLGATEELGTLANQVNGDAFWKAVGDGL